MDLSILFEPPNLDKEAVLLIEPLAPLSMVSDMPGSFYKSEVAPSKLKLCGLFENVLEWHFSVKDRKNILKKIGKAYKKYDKVKYKNFEKETLRSNVEYLPLLAHLFEVDIIMHDEPIYYSDLWKMQLFRWDGYSHPNGTMNISYELIGEKNRLRDENGKIDNKEMGKFFEKNRKKFPHYYTSPRQREYVVIKGNYKIKLKLDQGLYDLLSEQFEFSNLGYLGNSESWVHIKLIDNENITAFL